MDYAGDKNALEKNQNLEFERNKERFTFLKWGAKAFSNMLIVPPGSGIVHQVNLEYLARVVFASDSSENGKILYPDSVVGTDSHTTVIIIHNNTINFEWITIMSESVSQNYGYI